MNLMLLCPPICVIASQLIKISVYTDKKENEIFLMYKENQMGSVANSYMRKGFLIYEEMCKYLTIYEEAVSHI
jgi:hypothetical protein